MASYKSVNGQLVEQKGEVFSAGKYGNLGAADIAARLRATALRRHGFKVKRTFSHEFGAYHVAYWSPSGLVCGRCQRAIADLIGGGARCPACYSLDLAEVKAELLTKE